MARVRDPWQRVLYLRQDYSDNHLDDTFLESLKVNEGVQPYSYLSMCKSAMLVVQQLSLVCIFLSIWSRMQDELWRYDLLLIADLLLLASGYLLAIVCSDEDGGPGQLRLSDMVSDVWHS